MDAPERANPPIGRNGGGVGRSYDQNGNLAVDSQLISANAAWISDFDPSRLPNARSRIWPWRTIFFAGAAARRFAVPGGDSGERRS
jgi:hypothetical protein